ncbi:MAG: hypothetical protein NZ941_06635 [Candidatus Caldarchaeum sp.]|nr:hypothetical protein [Candidatus Caldarchaeum sp.]
MIVAEKKALQPTVAARYFLASTLVNACAAVAVAAPVLVARLALPLKLTEWPGTWMFVAYGVFVGFGVLGSLAWSAIYYLSGVLLGVKHLRRNFVVAQLLLHNIAAYGIGFLMGYAVGYVGGTARLEGFGLSVITALISWAVIPIGVLVFLGLVSTVLGVFTVLDSWLRTRE